MLIEELGWSPRFAEAFESLAAKGCSPGRVVSQHSDYTVVTAEGAVRCIPAGRLKFHAGTARELPVIGDWVAVRIEKNQATSFITQVLPRKSSLVRKVPGDPTQAQAIAANIDIAFLVSGLDLEFNPARIERYIVFARESGAEPVIVLNKSDLCTALEEARSIVKEIAGDIPVVVTSTKQESGVAGLRRYLGIGITGALLGSSGVGKSSILNSLLGEDRMRVQETFDDSSEGRHTTTHRELVLLPNGGMVIDTPGLRELQLWGDGTGVEDSFDDIAVIALQCKFSNCSHETEPGCAVRQALDNGTLGPDRFGSYLKMKEELSRLQGQRAARNRIDSKRKWKQRTTEYRKNEKNRRRYGRED